MIGEKITILSKSLDAGMLRSKLIADNISNVSTPGFKRNEVEFENELKQAMDKTHLRGVRSNEKHIPLGRKTVYEVKPEFYFPKFNVSYIIKNLNQQAIRSIINLEKHNKLNKYMKEKSKTSFELAS